MFLLLLYNILDWKRKLDGNGSSVIGIILSALFRNFLILFSRIKYSLNNNNNNKTMKNCNLDTLM